MRIVLEGTLFQKLLILMSLVILNLEYDGVIITIFYFNKCYYLYKN